MSKDAAIKVAQIIHDAGGQVVGRTRLQKIAYLLMAAGLEGQFRFHYKHFGPYSEDLAQAALEGRLLGLIEEREQQAAWGGIYSIYSAGGQLEENPARLELARLAARADAVELELAATAVFLAKEGIADPWAETARRKPEKAEVNRIDRAKALFGRISEVAVPRPWPQIH